MKWRLEYLIDMQDIDSASGSSRKKWRIYLDVVEEFFEPYAMREVEAKLPPNHPVLKYLNFIFKDTHERVFLMPFEPFELHESVKKCMDDGWLDRIHAREEACKVWASADGWTWMHYPGDSIR